MPRPDRAKRVIVQSLDHLMGELRQPRRKSIHIRSREVLTVEPERGRVILIEGPEVRIYGNGRLRFDGALRVADAKMFWLDGAQVKGAHGTIRDAIEFVGSRCENVMLTRGEALDGCDETVSVNLEGDRRAGQMVIQDYVILPDPTAEQPRNPPTDMEIVRHDYGSLFRDVDDLTLRRVLYGPGARRFPKIVGCRRTTLESVMALGCRDYAMQTAMGGKAQVYGCAWAGEYQHETIAHGKGEETEIESIDCWHERGGRWVHFSGDTAGRPHSAVPAQELHRIVGGLGWSGPLDERVAEVKRNAERKLSAIRV